MLELFALSALVNNIKKTALERGRRPGGFVAVAIILWFHLEFAGFFIGIYLEMGYGSVIPAAILVGLGALASYLLVRFFPVGKYIPPNKRTIMEFTENYEPLSTPCNITVTRDKSFSGGGVKYEVFLNDLSMGTVANGFTLYSTTDQRQNVIYCKAPDGTEFPPFVFEVADGGNADIHFATGVFIPNRSTGLIQFGKNVHLNPELAIPRQQSSSVFRNIATEPAASPDASPAASPAPAVPVAAEITAAPVAAPVSKGIMYCEHCGTAIEIGSKFCDHCGSPVLD